MTVCKWCDCSFGFPGDETIEHSVPECRAILEAKLHNANLQIKELQNRNDAMKMSLDGIMRCEEQKRQEHATALRLNGDLLKIVKELLPLDIHPSMREWYRKQRDEVLKPEVKRICEVCKRDDVPIGGCAMAGGSHDGFECQSCCGDKTWIA